MLLRSPHLVSEETPPFELKGSLFTLTVLRLFQLDRAAIERHLVEKVKQAPGFFDNTPVVLDLEGVSETQNGADFQGLYSMLRGHGLVPVGVRNGAQKLQAAARLAGLPVLPDSRSGGAKKPDSAPSPPPAVHSLIIHRPIRSGQEIYAPDGDLIVLGSVSAGADVMADGNIHVYGALRGRALAGVKGHVEAWIFCQSLAAKLVSIAGRYQTSEQLDQANQDKAVKISLKDDQLIVEPLFH